MYWLLRENGAKDFSYEKNLDDKHRNEMLKQHGNGYCHEVAIAEEVKPEKQHIVPYSTLQKLYNIKSRGRISRHKANNIGNLTYISRALNHYETGLGKNSVNLQEEPEENCKSHFLYGDELINNFPSALNEANSNNQKSAFEKFCAVRRGLIAGAFGKWLAKLPLSYSDIDKRIEPDIRINKQDEDRIRHLNLPDILEDALIDCAMTPGLKYDEKKSQQEWTCFKVQDDKRLLAFRILLHKNLPQIKITPCGTKHHLWERMAQLIGDAEDALLERQVERKGKLVGQWIMSADECHAQNVAMVFKKLRQLLAPANERQ